MIAISKTNVEIAISIQIFMLLELVRCTILIMCVCKSVLGDYISYPPTPYTKASIGYTRQDCAECCSVSVCGPLCF
jgi:hypothetical protein